MTKILNLPIRKTWYEMIERGVAREVFKEITPYWCRRLLKCDQEDYAINFRDDYTHVRFRYGNTKRTMMFEIDFIDIGYYGNPNLGTRNHSVFIIKFH